MPTAGLSPHSPHHHGSDSSDYLLLTTNEHSPLLPSPSPSSSSSSGSPTPTSSRLPRVALVQLAALADLCTTFALALRVPVTALPPSAVALNGARGAVVLLAVAVSSGAHLAPVMIGQLVLSTLVLLYRLNELVQTTTLPPGAWINPTTTWYLASFLCSLGDYALFLAVVGARRSLRSSSRRAWAAGETPWDGNVERVTGAARTRSERSASVGGPAAEEGARSDGSSSSSSSFDPGHGPGSDSDSSDDDADDIIDVPRPHPHLSPRSHAHAHAHTREPEPGLRNRASRASLLSAFSPPPRAALDGDAGERPGFGASRGYGSIRSLAGI
ncbi:hypothetical protein JCM9279_001193 [Rhodotorula babjevae]